MAKLETTSAPTKVIYCACSHDFQDKKYGRGKRLANRCPGILRPKYRCTVCGTTY